jgi:hypothetical protein
MRSKTSPALGIGMGLSSNLSTSGPPGVYITTARIVPVIFLAVYYRCGILESLLCIQYGKLY